MKNPELQLELLKIKDVVFGQKTTYQDGILTVHKDELTEAAKSSKLRNIRIDIARPGESVRIVPVKDVIEPRVKVESGAFFPGILSKPSNCGEGRTKVLDGCCVVTTGQIVFYQEGLIDMTGPAAEYSIYAKKINIVVSADPGEGVEHAEHEREIRLMGLRAAHYLAAAVKDAPADEIKTYQLKHSDEKLPRIGFCYLLLAQGLLHDNYIYGLNAQQLHPVLLHPNELMDGAIVSGNCVTACDKNTTYDSTANPVVLDLYERDGRELEFCGVIASPVSPVLKDKERNALGVLNLARLLELDGVIIAQEGGGNPESDLMMICQYLEQNGIRTVLMSHENCGKDGAAQGITIVAEEADAVISAANVNEVITLPPMEKVLGREEAVNSLSGVLENALKEDGSIQTTITIIMDAGSNTGVSKLGVTEY